MSTELSVWAPRAGDVDVIAGGERRTAVSAGGGWFRLTEPVPAGTEYYFSLDGGDLVPDPRSRWQPEGVPGPSKTLDHSNFRWTDDGWTGIEVEDLIIYELHIGTFTPEGTFEAATERVGHLRDLGVTAVELMPFAQFPGGRGWGYDAVQIFAPHCAYGPPEALKVFVDQCHASGIAVIADVVDNHLGPVENTLARFGPYFSSFHATPWGPGFNLDEFQAHEVRQYLIDSMLGWLDHYRMDGLRLDAVQTLSDSSAVHFLEELSIRVEELSSAAGRRKLLIAETDENDPRLVGPRTRSGLGLDALWSEDLHRSVHAYLTGETHGYYADAGGLEQIAATMARGGFSTGGVSGSRLRMHGRPVSSWDKGRFVGYLQSHDAVGNRPRGERLCHLVNESVVKVAALLLFSAPQLPMIFQGEEWAASSPFLYFADFTDGRIAGSVRRGRRGQFRAMGLTSRGSPDPFSAEAFEQSKLIWGELSSEPHSMVLDLYRRAIALRRAIPELRDPCGDIRCSLDADRGLLEVVRAGKVATICNFSARPIGYEVIGELLLATASECRIETGLLYLPPESGAVVRIDINSQEGR